MRSSRFLAETIPGARLWIVPGASHFANLDAPDLFADRVVTFLRECGAGG